MRENLSVAAWSGSSLDFYVFFYPASLQTVFSSSSHLLEYTLVLVMWISSSEGCSLVQWVIRATPISSGRGCRNHREDVVRGPSLPAPLQISISLLSTRQLFVFLPVPIFICQNNPGFTRTEGVMSLDYTRWIWDVSLIWTSCVLHLFVSLSDGSAILRMWALLTPTFHKLLSNKVKASFPR